MLKSILKIGKPLSKIEQLSINGGENAPPQSQGNEGGAEAEICYHCGLWIPCNTAYNSNIPCGIRPL